MKKKSDNFSITEAMALANSEAGQQLIALLKSSNDPNIQKAAQEASSGNYGNAKEALSGILSSQQVQALLEQLRRQSNG